MLTLRRAAAAALLLGVAACTASGASPRRSPSPTGSPTPTPAPTPAPSLSASPYPVALTKLGTFDGPLWVGPVPGDPEHLWLAERAGRVLEIAPDGSRTGLVLDLTKLVSKGQEQGLLGVALDPGFARNGLFYVDYTDLDGDTRVVRYTWRDRTAGQPRQLLVEDQPYDNHNGGELLFDRTGKLLVGLGDGGSAGDPGNRAQSLGSDLGKILRIDPATGRGLPDNPYPVNSRVWALGLRNPWRFSFDTNGDLYLGDVGQNKVEEVDVVPPRLQRGANYGWSVYEGDQVFKPAELITLGGPLIRPAYTYLHSTQGGCSVTGGRVYRGRAVPSLVGGYVFADYCIGRLMVARRTATGLTPPVEIGVELAGTQAFGVDAQGELLVMSPDALYRLTPG